MTYKVLPTVAFATVNENHFKKCRVASPVCGVLVLLVVFAGFFAAGFLTAFFVYCPSYLTWSRIFPLDWSLSFRLTCCNKQP
jgi:hypothetical protein